MAATRATTNMIVMEIFLPSLSFGSVRLFHISLPKFGGTPNLYLPWNQLQPRPVERRRQRGCLRFSNSCSRPMRELLPPATNLFLKSPSSDHVTVSFARSGGPGGQNVNKVNTKLDMRYNVKNAYWLNDRVRERIMHLEKNRINKDGVIVISSTKTRTQKGNSEDALQKLKKIIDAASYVPPLPSEEQVKKIAKVGCCQ